MIKKYNNYIITHNKLPYLNIGCGNKFNKAWVNIDMTSRSPDVIEWNLLNGIPFPNNHFEAVYHSQVLEHFQKNDAPKFLKECYRVLKPGGTIRIVVPNLENITREYLRLLEENLQNPSEESEANYDWIMLELFDQTVRNSSGGEMAAFFEKGEIINKDYIIKRIGHVGRTLLSQKKRKKNDTHVVITKFDLLKSLMRRAKNGIKYIVSNRVKNSYAYKIGSFRLGGEIHQWMYDRYSLSKLLTSCDFKSIEQCNPEKSRIKDWNNFELDIRGDQVFDPNSLIMEATKTE